jgi:hypothetical protein
MIGQHHMSYRQYGGCLDKNQLSAMLVGRLQPQFAPLTTINLLDESIVCDIGVLGEGRR